MKNEVWTSGEERMKVSVVVVRIPTVHVRAIGIGVANVHEVAVGSASFSYLLAICGSNEAK